MKKSISILLLLLSLIPSCFGQQLLRQSTATTVNIGPFQDSAGAATNPTVTNITVIWRKHTDTTSTSSTTWTPTSSGGSHDCVTDANDSSWKNCEVTSTDTGTVGRLDWSASVSGSLKVFGHFMVVPAATYDTLVTNGPASGADLLNTQTALLTTVGGFGAQMVANADSPVSGVKADTDTIITTIGTPAGADLSTDVANIYSRIGAPVGASISADVAGVQSDTDNIQTRIPAALVSGRIDSSVGAYQSGLAPLQPTTAGRTLDVTATGAAGIDWGNVENQSTTVTLSGTTTLDAIDAATVADIWAFPTASATTVGSIGKLDVDTAAAIGSPVVTVSADIAALQTDSTAIKAKTDQFVFTAANKVDASVRDWRGSTPNALISGRVDSSVGAYQTGLAPLQPTVSGRSLDVSAGGEAGIDWANVGTPGATVNLSATTVSAVSGAVGSVTGSVGGNVTGSVGSISGISFPSNFSLLSINGSGQVVLTSGANTSIAQAIRDLTIEGSLTNGQLTRLIAAVLIGKSSGSGTGTIIFRDANDTANRVTATVSGGNRTAVTLNP